MRKASVRYRPSPPTVKALSSTLITVLGRNPNTNDNQTITKASTLSKPFPRYDSSAITFASYSTHDTGSASRSSLGAIAFASLYASANINLMISSLSANSHLNKPTNFRIPLNVPLHVYTPTLSTSSLYRTKALNAEASVFQGTTPCLKHQAKKNLK